MKKLILETLYKQNKDLFFNKISGDSNYENNSYVYIWRYFTGEIDIFELKDEYKQKLDSLSLFEMLQIVDNNEQLRKDVKTIKNWVLFLGILWLVSIFVYVIYLSL